MIFICNIDEKEYTEQEFRNYLEAIEYLEEYELEVSRIPVGTLISIAYELNFTVVLKEER